jgi:UDP-N-acetylmuramyl pentapeptide phosphotransferase/UDP-N-acetylglucosamine-1-phosphate transferase
MLDNIPPYIVYPLAFIIAAIISWYAVRKVIFITRRRKLYDIPDNIRKIHGAEIPSLGGIGIFIGYVLPCVFFLNQPWLFVLASSIVLFFTGIYDDLMNMSPSKKLYAQLIASFIAIHFTKVGPVLYSLAGTEWLPYSAALLLMTLFCTFFINVFNFIDGIDGLACGMAVLYIGMFGILFLLMEEYGYAGIAFCLAGATIGLLIYNRPPAKIYMGDTGSMVLGFTIFMFGALIVAQFPPYKYLFTVGARPAAEDTLPFIHTVKGAAIIVFATLFLPMYDAIRVFILRASKGISPLRADRTHLHYYMLDAGFTHGQSVLIILSVNIVLVITGFFLQGTNPILALVALTSLTTLFVAIVYRLRLKKLKANYR